MDGKTEFAAAVSRVHKVSATSLIIALILTLIISQQMREHQATFKRLAHEDKSYIRQEKELNARLKSERSKNARLFDSATKADPSLLRTDAQLTVRVARDATARKERLDEIDKRLARNEKLIDESLPKVEEEKKKREEEEKKKREGMRSIIPLRAGTSPRVVESSPIVMLPPALERGTASKTPDATESLGRLQAYHASLAQYRKTYAEASALRDRVEQHLIEARELRRSKQSLPTPFGNFEVSPRLGLIGVLVGLIAAQIYVLSVARRARRIAETFQHDNPGVAITELPAPAWLDAFGGRDLSQTLAWTDASPMRLVRGFAIHAIWLILAGYLAWEIFRWHAADDVLLAPSLLVYVLTIGALVTGFVAMVVFLADAGPPRTEETSFSVSRRQFFALAGTLIGLAVAFVAFPRLRSKRRKNTARQITIAKIGASEKLVVSRRTRTVHHLSICRRHLPAEHERAPMLPTDALHVQCRIAILTQLASETYIFFKDVTKGIDFEKTFAERQRLLAVAIGLEPQSIHLYDAIIANALNDSRFVQPALTALASGAKIATDALKKARAQLKSARGRHLQKRAQVVVARSERFEGQILDRTSRFEKRLRNKILEEKRHQGNLQKQENQKSVEARVVALK